eukprot:scaffold5009_cov172-Prasinococcus_capsulatus_cf.AAC.4
MWLVMPCRRSRFDYRQTLGNELANPVGHTEDVTTLVFAFLSEAKCSFWEAIASKGTWVVKRGQPPLPASRTGTRRNGHLRVERGVTCSTPKALRVTSGTYTT